MSIIKNLYYSFIFLADQRFKERTDYIEKFFVVIKLLAAFGPIAFLLETISMWFQNNKEFVTGFIIIVSLNAWLGIKKHRKLKTFNWETFYKKTSLMLMVVIVTYVLLSIIGKFAGDNIISEGFQILLQVTTLFYPASKGLKSIFVLSNGEYPPKWIMNRVYNFEEEGNLGELFKSNKEGESNESN